MYEDKILNRLYQSHELFNRFKLNTSLLISRYVYFEAIIIH